MARSKNYQREHVIDAAMQVFWQHGYAATSIAQLCEASGLNKRSLYNEFGSKAELFEEALIRYRSLMNEPAKLLMATPLGAQNVIHFFEFIAQSTAERFEGCLLTLALNETNQLEAQHRDNLQRHFSKLEEGLLANLAVDLPPAKAKIMSQYLLNSLLGLTSWIRLKPSRDEYENVINTLLEPLRAALDQQVSSISSQ